MLYIMNTYLDGTCDVRDTEDGAIDHIHNNEAIRYVEQGIDIKGVSAGVGLVYAVRPYDNTRGYVYCGRRIADLDYEAILCTQCMTRNVAEAYVDFPIDYLPKVDRQRNLLMLCCLEDMEVVYYMASLLEFLDNNWSSNIRRVRVRIYSETASPVVRELTCLIGTGFYLDKSIGSRTHIASLPVSLSVLSYLDYSKLGDGIEFRDKFDKFLEKYPQNRVAVSKIIPLTQEHWSDGKNLIYFNDDFAIPCNEVVTDLFTLVTTLRSTESGLASDDGDYTVSSIFHMSMFGSKENYPMFDALSALLFDCREVYGEDTHGMVHSIFTYARIKREVCLSRWDGLIAYITDCRDSRYGEPADFSRAWGDYTNDSVTMLSFERNRLIIHAWSLSYRSTGISVTELQKLDFTSGYYRTLYGIYYLDKNELLDSVGIVQADKQTCMLSFRSKLIGQNVEMGLKDTVTSISCNNADGIISLPVGGKYIGDCSIRLGVDTKKVIIPDSYIGVDKHIFDTKHLHSSNTTPSIELHLESKSEKFLISFVRALYKNQRNDNLDIDICFCTRTARVPLAVALLGAYTNTRWCGYGYYSTHCTSVFEYLKSLSQGECQQLVQHLRKKVAFDKLKKFRLSFKDSLSYEGFLCKMKVSTYRFDTYHCVTKEIDMFKMPAYLSSLCSGILLLLHYHCNFSELNPILASFLSSIANYAHKVYRIGRDVYKYCGEKKELTAEDLTYVSADLITKRVLKRKCIVIKGFTEDEVPDEYNDDLNIGW